MEVAGEVNVDILHRDDLAVTAAGGSALHSEDWPQGGLAERQGYLFAELRQCLRKADGGRSLALPRRSRGYRGDKNQLAVLVVLYLLPKVKRNLRLILAVKLKIIRVNVEFFRNIYDGLHRSLLRYLNVAKKCHSDHSCFILNSGMGRIKPKPPLRGNISIFYTILPIFLTEEILFALLPSNIRRKIKSAPFFRNYQPNRCVSIICSISKRRTRRQ